jgi:hypothetical protein
MNDVAKSATISTCGRYRYRLWRTWDDQPYLPFIMLNPSTADAENDDPTIRRCMGFARDGGFGGIVVVNLFAFRATSPDDMKRAVDPVGRGNNEHIKDILSQAADNDVPVLAAWGTHGIYRNQDAVVRRLADRPLWCLGKTKDGHPRHPLYVRSDAKWEVL